jgi:UDP:flavonoid glycosyltransferase YjiC (YdhE family)
MFPAVGDMYDDLAGIVSGADVLIASELVFVAPLLSATHSIPWVAYFLAPVSLFSQHDPPILPLPSGWQWLPRLGPPALRLVRRIGKLVSRSWWRPLRRLRKKHGLPAGGHPLFEGKISPLLNLALYSPVLQPPQRDWPARTVQTGFCFFDETPGGGPAALPAPVEKFLQQGEAPIVFTLGSAAVFIARDFYAQSAGAAAQLGRRALLLLGSNPPPVDLPASILPWDYLPYASIFPRAAIIVHQGGVGTTAQALRSGRPMLIVPFAHDQFDNAARVARLGSGRRLARSAYQAPRVAHELAKLLGDARYADTAAKAGARVRAEDGVAVAADALEDALTVRR